MGGSENKDAIFAFVDNLQFGDFYGGFIEIKDNMLEDITTYTTEGKDG